MNRVARRLRRFERHRCTIEKEIHRMISRENGNSLVKCRFIRPKRGVTTLTFIVECDGIRCYVLRCLPGRRKLRHLCQTSTFCRERGIPVPRVLSAREGFWCRLRNGFYLTLEEFVEADPIEEAIADQARHGPTVVSLASRLATLHDLSRPEHGPVFRPQRRAYLSQYLKKALQKLQKLRNTFPEISHEDATTVQWFLMKQSTNISEPTRYSLIHGALGGGNVLAKESGEVILIDLEHMHFGMPQYDLQSVRHYLLKDDEEAFAAFQQTYHSARKKKDGEDSAPLEVLFRVFVLLKSLRPELSGLTPENWRRQWREILDLTHSDKTSVSSPFPLGIRHRSNPQ